MGKTQALLVGETWVSSATHFKGFDRFDSVTFHSGADPFLAALADSDFEITHLPAHEAVEKLPFTLDGLARYQAIILSDIGSNSLLLPPDVWLHGKRVANRLRLIHDWTEAGGGLIMIGGYLSFQGIDGKARWRRTPVERALPVSCLPFDDRIETPEGFVPDILALEHPVLAGIDGPWPYLLGANEVILKDTGTDDPQAATQTGLLARLPPEQGGHPLLVAGCYGKGRTLVWTSDIGPHWLPPAFIAWPGYARLWRNILGWVTQKT